MKKNRVMLSDVLQKAAGKPIQLCIGCSTGYWFIGTESDFRRDIDLLEWHYFQKCSFEADKLRAQLMAKSIPKEYEKEVQETLKRIENRMPLPFRQVLRTFRRNFPGEPMPQIAVIVAGADKGECVFHTEYTEKVPQYFAEYRKLVETGKTPSFLVDSRDEIPEAWTRAPTPRKRPTKPPTVCGDDNWLDFANDIIVQAAKDYKSLYKISVKKGKAFNSYEAKRIEDFFRSDWCTELAGGQNQEYLVDQLKKLALEEMEEEERSKKKRRRGGYTGEAAERGDGRE